MYVYGKLTFYYTLLFLLLASDVIIYELSPGNEISAVKWWPVDEIIIDFIMYVIIYIK